MGLFTTVTTYDSNGHPTHWQFDHGLDQCQFYVLNEQFGREMEYDGGRYDVDGVYGAYGCDDKMGLVVVKDNAVVRVEEIEMQDPVFGWYTPEVSAKGQRLADEYGLSYMGN